MVPDRRKTRGTSFGVLFHLDEYMENQTRYEKKKQDEIRLLEILYQPEGQGISYFSENRTADSVVQYETVGVLILPQNRHLTCILPAPELYTTSDTNRMQVGC